MKSMAQSQQTLPCAALPLYQPEKIYSSQGTQKKDWMRRIS